VYCTKVDTCADLVARINNACVHINNCRHELQRATCSILQCVHKCIEVGGGIFENLLCDAPDVDDPGFCPLQIISNTMVSTCMYVMLFITQLLFVLTGWSISSFYHISVNVQNRIHVHMDFSA